MVNGTRERAEPFFIGRYFAGQRHRHVGTSMKTAAKSDNTGTTGMRAGDFHRIFHSFCASSEECGFAFTVNRRNGVDFLSQRHIAFVRYNLISRVGKSLQLRFDCLHQTRMTVPGVQHGNPGGKINILIALNIGNRAVFCRLGVKITHDTHATRGGIQTTLLQVFIVHSLHLVHKYISVELPFKFRRHLVL